MDKAKADGKPFFIWHNTTRMHVWTFLSPEYQAMEPNATYAVLTESMIYDPESIFAGVAGPMFTAAGNAFTAAANGEMDAADAVADMKAELDGLQ